MDKPDKLIAPIDMGIAGRTEDGQVMFRMLGPAGTMKALQSAGQRFEANEDWIPEGQRPKPTTEAARQ